MSLDVHLNAMRPTQVYWRNITHNLNTMAQKAGLYLLLWRPDELGMTRASELIPGLEEGLAKLTGCPTYYKVYNPENGWGDYDGFVDFVTEYLQACKDNPDAEIEISR